MSLETERKPSKQNQIDCSDCSFCYPHPIAWGEYWCSQTNESRYNIHQLGRRFRDECEMFKQKIIKKGDF